MRKLHKLEEFSPRQLYNELLHDIIFFNVSNINIPHKTLQELSNRKTKSIFSLFPNNSTQANVFICFH